MAYNPNFNPNCGACGGLNSRGYCNYTACRFPQVTSGTVITVNPPIYVDDTPKPLTNYDLLRAKSVEEMAEFFNGVEAEAIRRAGLFITVGDIQRGKECWLDWLKQEVSTNG